MTAELVGAAAIVRAAYEKRDLSGLLAALQQRIAADPHDAAALLDLATLLEVSGQRERSAKFQAAALAGNRLYQTRNGSGLGLRVLLIKTAGDLMANTPAEFLLEKSDVRLLSLFVDAGMTAPPPLPPHDVALLAVGESEANRPVLEILRQWRTLWPHPVLNNAPERIVTLARERLAAAFPGCRHVVVPETLVVTDAALWRLVEGVRDETAAQPTFPLIVRLFGAHAGRGTEKIEYAGDLADYLQHTAGQRFTVTPFLDYAGPDGYFRKQRIVFIDGHAYASHMAVSRRWMVHYLNAEMETHPDRREQEAAWMQDFDRDFAVRHAAAFEEIVTRIGLDYFAIDCGELPDGRLVLFEADTAMIVHAMDPPDLFPYKQPAMRKLFAAFEAALQRRTIAAAAA